MGLVKTVQLAVTGDIRDASSKIDVLRGQADKLTADPVDFRAELTGSEEVKAKLDDIDAHAELLKREFPEFEAKIDTSSATSKMAVLRRDLLSLTRDANGPGGSGGGGGGGGGGFLSSIGDAFSGGLTSPAALTTMAAAALPLLTEVTGLVSGFAAAGAGVGAFGLLAAPAIKAVAGAIGDTRKQMAGLSPDERGAVEGIQKLEKSFTKMSDAFQPAAFKVFNDALKVANTLLPHLTPFANTAAKAIGGLLKDFNSFAGSAAFKDWLKQFQKLEGPSITAIGTGFGHVATSLGKLLTVMSAKDVVNAINIAFSILDGTVIGLTKVVQFSMQVWDHLTTYFNLMLKPGLDKIRHAVAVFADGFVTAFTTVGKWLVASDTDMGNWTNNVGRLIGNVVRFFAKLPGEIRSALSGLGSLLFNIGKNAVQSLINGLMSLWDKLTSIIGKIKGFFGFGGGGGGGGGGGKLPNVNVGLGGAPAQNARLAQQMVPAWGSGANWNAWNYVAMKESGWNQHALNASSGAYGIPQALPASKMGAAANPPTSSPGAQIAWMVQYMRGRYGGPQGAAAHEQAFNWYDSGVQMLPPGLSIAMNGTGRPERVGGEDIAPLLRQILAVLQQSPQATGSAMARGLQGTARRAGARGMYSARGAWA